MPVRKRIASVQKNAEIKLRDIGLELSDVLQGDANSRREAIEKRTQTPINDFVKFIDLMGKGELQKVKEWIDTANIASNAAGTPGALDTFTLRTTYNEIADLVAKNVQVSHQGSGILTQRLFVMYIELNRISQADEDWLMAGKNSTVKLPKQNVPDGIKTTFKSTQAQAKTLAEKIRQLWIASKAVTEMNIKDFSGDSIQDIDNALEQYFENEDQDSHLITKVKEVDSLTGKIHQRIAIEHQKARSDADKLLGKSKNLAFDKKRDTDLQGVLNKYAKDFGDIAGSKAITNEVIKQLTDVAVGKKKKKYKSSSEIKLAKNKKNSKSPNAKRLKRAISKAGKLKVPPLAAKVMQEAGSEKEDQVSVVRLKTLINKRLSAEVRRNMGRPALMNRTGRFSNSVELLNLRETPKGITGDYTYQLNPYQTFENTGQRRWPLGYNPKALITKSIRNLAIQYTETKFNRLRRT